MSDYLVNHAIKNVWCTPDQDNQTIFKLAKLTPTGGVINRFRLHWREISLPELYVRYQILHIGQIHPSLINLLDSSQKWNTFSNACNGKDIIVNIYTASGIELPRTRTWYMRTKTNDILIAVEQNDRIPFNFNDDSIYFRSYYNAYFASSRSSASLDGTFVEGDVINSSQDIIAMQSKVNAKKALTGLVNCYVNGYRTSSIDLTNTSIGDTVEYSYDSSVKSVIEFRVKDLPTFDSTLDSKGKYLLHVPNNNTTTIEFQDDIDLYLTDGSKGVYVNKNNTDAFRNITHKDYSVVVSYIQSYFNHFLKTDGSVDIDNIKLQLHIRKSGYSRALILERNKINELYKLPNAKIVSAMVGLNSTVNVWKAAQLERSAYIALMSMKFNQITKAKVADAYGYDAIAKIVGDTPFKVTVSGANRSIPVPYLLRTNSTAFEYTATGHLINWYSHTSGQTYIARNTTTQYVEMLSGVVSDKLDESHDLTGLSVETNKNYRFYQCGLENSIPDNNWVDVTGTNNYSISSTNGAITWNGNNKFTLVRSDSKFICYRVNKRATQGVLEIPITYLQKRSTTYQTLLMQIPLRDLDVFLNGRSLIEGLDYYYTNPTIIIVNKSYLSSNGVNDIVIRFRGHCDSNLSHNTLKDFGFIQRGKLSDNHRFNIKDGRVQRIVVSGSLRVPSEVSYFEDTGSGAIFTADNGKPYCVKDILVYMNEIASRDTYSFKKESEVTDKTISDYMSINTNQQSAPVTNVVSSKHILYSPFLSRLLDDLISGAIPSNELSSRYNDNDVRRICSSFTNLLEIDPINVNNKHSPDYVMVEPYVKNEIITLDFNKYALFRRANELYGNDVVDISSKVRLT